MDYNLCIICQEHTDKPTRCPGNKKLKNENGSAHDSVLSIYQKFISNARVLQALEPSKVRFDTTKLDASVLRENNAVWHLACHLKFNNNEISRAQKRHAETDADAQDCPTKTRNTRQHNIPEGEEQSNDVDNCLFCNEREGKEKLHNIQKIELSQRTLKYATTLCDGELLPKLMAGHDLVASEGKYHLKCLTRYNYLYDKKINIDSNTSTESERSRNYSVALGYIVNYLEEQRENCISSFLLKDVTNLFENKLKELGSNDHTVNRTTLKERIIKLIPCLNEVPIGRQISLVFDEGISKAVQQSLQDMWEEVKLARAARILRNRLISTINIDKESSPKSSDKNQNTTQESKTENDQLHMLRSYPPELYTFLCRMLYGVPYSVETVIIPVINSMCQLLTYHLHTSTMKVMPSSLVTRHRNNKDDATLLHYVATKIWGATRSKDLIEKLSYHGLCIPYTTLMNNLKDKANLACDRYHEEGVVCPIALRNGVFTTAAVDNIDYNPTSTQSSNSFHGTAISLVQHPTIDNLGEQREINMECKVSKNSKDLRLLPSCYSIVPAASQSLSSANMTACSNLTLINETTRLVENKTVVEWLNHANSVFNNVLDSSNCSWSSHNASKLRLNIRPQAITALLPMFEENSHSVAMVLHSLNVIKAATQHLNNDQTPVVAMDLLLYVIAKQIQWMRPDTHGEDKFVIMLGGLHTEMSFLKMIGKWFKGCGITDLLVEAGVTTAGRAEVIINVSHIKRARYFFTIIAATLYILMDQAFIEHCKQSKSSSNSNLTFSDWRVQQCNRVPQFQFYEIRLQLILLILEYSRSIHESNFQLYVTALSNLAPWFFSLDHFNYGKWVPVHLRDMTILAQNSPLVAEQFENGLFTVLKSERNISAISLDEAHEQENATIKGCGGAVGLFSNPKALLKLQLVGPHVSTFIEKYESEFSRVD